MATDLDTRKASTKSEAYLRRKFAELCARIKRVDLFAHLLALVLAVLSYALFIGLFDWFAGNTTATAVHATRWIAFAAFVAFFGFLLVQTARCLFHRVNPYYVARQLEQTLPDANNALINWLDLCDEEIPAAFQRNLSSSAADRLQVCDAERTVPKRKAWIMLGALAMPALGLGILLVLGPAAFAASMLRAFVPFYTPPPIARTQITLLQPEGGDAEVSPTQAITFAAKIEGRVPDGNRPNAPRLSYRYQADEAYLFQLLQQGADGTWTAQMHPGQIRTGFSYKISAGDAETPVHQVRVRARAHVKQFEITYQHRPYRKLPKTTTSIFPNADAARPIIHGPRGSEVELIVRASRPVQKASVEVMTAGVKQEQKFTMLSADTFRCRWMLDQPGQFRVAYASIDGEENTDRDFYPIEVPVDEAPTVVLTKPGQDVQLPENGFLELEGHAVSSVGVKNLTLHLRPIDVAGVKATARPYRPGTSFEQDGAYPAEIGYLEVVPLNQFLEKGPIHHLPPGTEIEYWLEAADASDFPNPAGNVGKSVVYKVTLTPKPADSKQQEIERKNAKDRQEKHNKKQDADRGNEKNSGSGSRPNEIQKQLDANKKDGKGTEDKVKKALEEKQQQEKTGSAKSAEPQNSAAKDGPPNSPDGPQPKEKDRSMPPENAGSPKDQGDDMGKAGEPKDGGASDKKKESAKGERKDGPKESAGGAKDGGTEKKEPAGGTKDAGATGMNTPMPQPAKEQAPDDGAPMPISKGAPGEPQTQGHAKGNDQNGPELPNKGAQADAGPPPGGTSKSGMMSDAGSAKNEPKQGPPDDANKPGSARGDDANAQKKEPSHDDMIQMIEQLAEPGAKGEDAAQALAKIGAQSADPAKSDIARAVLEKNRRDPKTGKLEKKPGGTSGGKSPGLSDQVKAAAANREFIARIGQLQLDDWQKRMTPDLLKKAGLSEAEFQRYVKSRQAHDALVRELNAKLLQKALRDLRGGAATGTSLREVDYTGAGNDPLTGRAPPPPELRDVMRRFTTRPNP